MERQPVSERVMRNRGTEPGAVPLVSREIRSKPWPLSWPDLPGMLQPLSEIWTKWREATKREQWHRLSRVVQTKGLEDMWNQPSNTPTEAWSSLAKQLLEAETSDPLRLDRAVTGPMTGRFRPEDLAKLQTLMRKHLQQWPSLEGLDPENVWALVCQPVQSSNLVLVQGSPEAIGQALAQHLVVGTLPNGRSASLRLPGTAVQLDPEQATAASWAADQSGLFLRLVESTE